MNKLAIIALFAITATARADINTVVLPVPVTTNVITGVTEGFPVKEAVVTTTTNVTTAATAKAPAVSAGDAIYNMLSVNETNLVKRIELYGGYGVMWNRVGRKDAEAVSKGAVTGVQGDLFSHRWGNGWLITGGGGYGVMLDNESQRTLQTLSAGFGGNIPIGSTLRTDLGALSDVKDTTPLVKYAPVSPRVIGWHLGFMTRPDVFTPGGYIQASIPIGN